MNTPFSRSDLSRFIQEGTDAVVSKVTFPDGTSQTTAVSPPLTAFRNSSDQRALTIVSGNPSDVTNPGNTKGGAVTELSTSIVLPNANQNVFITCRVVGELNINSANFGLILHRSGGGLTSKFLRPPADGDRGRFLTPSVISINDDDSSLDAMIITFVDDTTTNAGTYIYTPVCVRSEGNNSTYHLNNTSGPDIRRS